LGGSLPQTVPLPETGFREFCDSYLKAVGDGALESNTVGPLKIHLAHFQRMLSGDSPIRTLTLSHLQKDEQMRSKVNDWLKNLEGPYYHPMVLGLNPEGMTIVYEQLFNRTIV
jgi:hypothetical protein